MKINVLCNDKNSWFWSYEEQFTQKLINNGHKVSIYSSEKDLLNGDLAIFISCTKIISKDGLLKNSSNIVCHPSDLPKGKGFSPIAWEILEGLNEITFTLFEANEGIDDGDFYFKEKVFLKGDELNDDLRKIQANTTFNLIYKYVSQFPKNKSYPQNGNETFYTRRTTQDSELDLNKTINEQFNLLRIVDNDLYPAFFIKNGKKYKIKIEKSND
jgi:methionyl-tRNA formyltransferase